MSKIKISSTTNKGWIKRYFKIIDENELHSGREGYTHSALIEICQFPYKIEFISAIALARHKKEYVGCSLAIDPEHNWDCNCATYVLFEYRRQGLGSALIKEVISMSDIDNYCHPENFPKI